MQGRARHAPSKQEVQGHAQVPDRSQPSVGGFASLHAPSLKIRIPRDYTTDPDASLIDSKLAILERLFVPAHIPVQHIWEVDWIRLGETAYLQSPDDEINPDLVPSGVRLYNSEELECADSQY